jgi:hypothetical protein
MTTKGYCEHCGKYSAALHCVEDEQRARQYEELIGVPYPVYDYLCDECAGFQQSPSNLLATPSEVIQPSPFIRAESKNFNINSFKGKIAQIIVETIFIEFGFEVFPFGYESYFTSIIRNLSGNGSVSSTALRLRSMPDLMVFNPTTKSAFLIEVKSTKVNYGEYLIGTISADRYAKFWAESFLAIVCARSQEIFTARISELNLPTRSRKSFSDGQEGYVLNFEKDFSPLDAEFGFDSIQYMKLLKRLVECLGEYKI